MGLAVGANDETPEAKREALTTEPNRTMLPYECIVQNIFRIDPNTDPDMK